MIKKILAIGFFLALFFILSAGCLIVAAHLALSSTKAKMFIAGNLSRIIPSGDVHIGSIKLLVALPPFSSPTIGMSFNDIKIYGKIQTQTKIHGKIKPPKTDRPTIFSCHKIVIRPDWRALLTGKFPERIKEVEAVGAELNLTGQKLKLKNLNAVISDISRSNFLPLAKNNDNYRAVQTNPSRIKFDSILTHGDGAFECDVSLDDGYVDFPSGVLTINKLSSRLKNGVEIPEIKGVVKFEPPENLSYHLNFELKRSDVEKILTQANAALKLFKMIKFGRNESGDEKFHFTVFKKSDKNSPTEISITPRGGRMKITLLF